MTRLRPTPATSPLLLALVLASCTLDASDCTEIACDSTLQFDYGSLSVDEPYLLTIRYADTSKTVECLDPATQPSEAFGVSCDEHGFELTPFADRPELVTVTIVAKASDEALASEVSVPVSLIENTEINGPGCPGGCLTFFGYLDYEPDGGG